MTTQIEIATNEINKIEAEIEAVRARVRELGGQLAGLANASEPDDISRKIALTEALRLARFELPVFPVPVTSEWRPPMQLRLELAQRRLADLRTVSHNLAEEIERIEVLERGWAGELSTAVAAWRTVARIFNAASYKPVGLNSGLLFGIGLTLQNIGREIASLPTLRVRLAEIGESDWEPSSWQNETDRAFSESQHGGKA